MMVKLRTKKTAKLKMVFTAHLAIILALVISISISEKVIAQEVDKEKTIQVSGSENIVQEDSIYKVLDPMPGFPGGEDARIKFLVKNMKYPEKARKEGIHGRVFVSFVIEKNGETSNIKLLRGIGGGCDEEAMRVVSIMPRWEPGLHEGKPVRVQFNMPFSFKLDNGEKNTKEDKSNSGPPPPYKK